MLKTLTFAFGPNSLATELVVDPLSMTVFVGPNNSGKSLVLREVQQYAETGRPANLKIVKHLEVAFPDPSSAAALVRARETSLGPGEVLQEAHVRVVKSVPSAGSASTVDVNFPHLLQHLEAGWNAQNGPAAGTSHEPWPGIFRQFISLYTIALDGRTRFALTESRPAGDLQRAPQNHLAALFVNDDARSRVRGITNDAFSLFFVIDPTNLGNLRIRMSLRPPADSSEEQSVDQRARSFHAAAIDIAELSDGVKAFTGLVSALVSSDFRIVLVDEPEAFLHPPLARKLGATMAALATERNANVFAATHSAHFLMGCIESGTQTNIIRLTYSNGRPTARLLPHSRLSALMRDPLLRSTGVLNALFHASAVVCEADRDRAFYEEINARLAAARMPSVADGVFLNAQNKQTIHRIVRPLREMGIPAAAVVDIDIIKGGDLKVLLEACFVPEAVIHSLTTLRGDIESKFRTLNLNMKAGGILQLSGSDRQALESLIEQLRLFGVLVVSIGEVEGWLGMLGLNASKELWLSAVFERMRSDPNDADYVRPQAGDVWDFISSVASWTANVSRRGMPSS